MKRLALPLCGALLGGLGMFFVFGGDWRSSLAAAVFCSVPGFALG